MGEGITLDAAGNVIVIGYETVAAQGKNIWLRKCTNADVFVWTQSFNGMLNLDDLGYGVVTKPAGDIFFADSVQNAAAQGGTSSSPRSPG